MHLVQNRFYPILLLVCKNSETRRNSQHETQQQIIKCCFNKIRIDGGLGVPCSKWILTHCKTAKLVKHDALLANFDEKVHKPESKSYGKIDPNMQLLHINSASQLLGV